MRILVVATKSPWPPRDGGRLVLWLTLRGLAESGHRLALLAPEPEPSPATVEALSRICEPHLLQQGPRSWSSALLGTAGGQALSLARHAHPGLQRAAVDLLPDLDPHLIHSEQLQALANCPRRPGDPPVLLRMQNVESDLWQGLGAGHPLRWPLRLEARRLRKAEAAALATVARCVALTERDAARLRELAPADASGRVEAVSPPFPRELPAAGPLTGAPAVVLGGSGGWRPNRDAMRWFLRAVVPRLCDALPAAVTHAFGPDALPGPGIQLHPAPADSIDTFPAGAIAAVPLFTGSGIRMRILEAWARGLPVVASPVAAAGLAVRDGDELLLANDAAGFMEAIARLAADAALRDRLVEAGRAYLRQHHDPMRQTASLQQAYRHALAARA